MSAPTEGSDNRAAKLKLAIGAIGVVFGDIGTSPLYAFRETFASHHGAPGIQVDPVHIMAC
jgi:KUP system potassium uptake protein